MQLAACKISEAMQSLYFTHSANGTLDLQMHCEAAAICLRLPLNMRLLSTKTMQRALSVASAQLYHCANAKPVLMVVATILKGSLQPMRVAQSHVKDLIGEVADAGGPKT